MAGGTINLRREDLGFYTEGVDSHNGRYHKETKRHQEEVRDRNKYAQHSGPKTFERHHPCSFNTPLFAKLKHLHGAVRCYLITCREYLSGVLGGVVHGWFVALESERFL